MKIIPLHISIGSITYPCTSVEGGACVHDEDASFAVCVSPTLTEGSEHASFACEAKFERFECKERDTHEKQLLVLNAMICSKYVEQQ